MSHRNITRQHQWQRELATNTREGMGGTGCARHPNQGARDIKIPAGFQMHELVRRNDLGDSIAIRCDVPIKPFVIMSHRNGIAHVSIQSIRRARP